MRAGRWLVAGLLLGIAVSGATAAHRMRGGKAAHSRQKRTIGDIINWKLNLLQTIFGGITGLFGGGGRKPGGRPSYGPPQRPPQRPSYGPPQRPQRPPQRPSYGKPPPPPSYGGGGGRPRPPPRQPSRPPGGGGGSQVFGPASVFYHLPAPNLATEAPQGAAPAGGGGYGAAASYPSQSQDSYRQPKFVPTGDAYGAPLGGGVAATAAQGDGYGAPQANVIVAAAPATDTDSYGAPAAPASDTYGGAVGTVVAAAPAIDSYGGAAAPAIDSYGGAQAPVLAVVDPVIVDNSVLDEYDEYDPNDVPADQAAPGSQPTYGGGIDTYGRDSAPIIRDNSEPVQDLSFESPVIQVVTLRSPEEAVQPQGPFGTSAPVPDDAFTVDSQAPTSFDTYGTNSISEPVDDSDLVVDLTEKLRIEPVVNTEFAEAPGPDVDAAPLPPVVDLTDYDYSNKVNDITLELINEEAVDSSTSAPVFITYPPETEGLELEEVDLRTPAKLVVQPRDEEGASLSDPLNVIPDEYEYDDYDPNDVPADQARPLEELNTYVPEEQPTYGPAEQPAYVTAQQPTYVTFTEAPAATNAPAPVPAFDDANLREVDVVGLRDSDVDFPQATLGPVADVPITTYSPEIDFDFGTTSDEGIEVVELQTAVEELGPDPAEYLDDALAGSNDIEYESQYDDEYEEESVTSYQPDNVDIPIVVEEAPLGESVDLPSYDPVVLLVGTPEAERAGKLQATHIPLFSQEELEEKKTAKRNTRKNKNKKKKNGLKDRYNNWFGTRNDWSKRIQRVQGRIRYKNANKRS